MDLLMIRPIAIINESTRVHASDDLVVNCPHRRRPIKPLEPAVTERVIIILTTFIPPSGYQFCPDQ
jgi:hypothetical protein